MDQYENVAVFAGGRCALRMATASRYARLKAHRFTLQMPACVTVNASARVLPVVSGSS